MNLKIIDIRFSQQYCQILAPQKTSLQYQIMQTNEIAMIQTYGQRRRGTKQKHAMCIFRNCKDQNKICRYSSTVFHF